jgi:hypothetical protein
VIVSVAHCSFWKIHAAQMRAVLPFVANARRRAMTRSAPSTR